jgi:hypothetical protein
MSDISVLKKDDCISIRKPEQEHIIHPLVNSVSYYKKIDNDKTYCLLIPQIIDYYGKNILIYYLDQNKIKKRKEKNRLIFDSKNKDIEDTEISETISELSLCNDECNNPLISFSLPINSNNFLDVVFSIANMEHLYDWLNNCHDDDKKMIGNVLDLFWKNYNGVINENIELFIKINHKIINIMFNHNLSHEIVVSISVSFIKKYYGKKINYLNKIKKNLMKYI